MNNNATRALRCIVLTSGLVSFARAKGPCPGLTSPGAVITPALRLSSSDMVR